MLTRAITAALIVACAAQLRADSSCVAPRPVLVGSEWERYARVAQLVGAVERQPWTLRQFGPRQWSDLLPRDSTLPWARLEPGFARVRCVARGSLAIFAPRLRLIHNGTFPLGENDAAVWAGRGLTTVADAGVSAGFGPLTVTFAPLAFSSENASFAIRANGETGDRAFADWRNPLYIDLPQRFGGGRYSRFDLGQSEARLDFSGAAVGVSTANQFWGPAMDHPIVLGNNAAGFPHLFAGTSRPTDVWRLGRVHSRVFWGSLAETRYSPLAGFGTTRLVSGLVAVFEPRLLPGLEIGGGRFFHVLQNGFRLDKTEFLRPFGALFKSNRAQQVADPDNQLATVFARLALPGDGIEVYGEFGREDHNWNLREFWQFLDHDAAYLLGGQKAWRRSDDILVLRAEVLNSRISHLALASSQAPLYVHSVVRQGHTNYGQALGSAAGYGGGASVLAIDRYSNRGRTTLSWERLQLADSRPFGTVDPMQSDIAHIWRVNTRRFGHRADAEFGVAAVYEINRQLLSDKFNLQTTLSVFPSSRRR